MFMYSLNQTANNKQREKKKNNSDSFVKRGTKSELCSAFDEMMSFSLEKHPHIVIVKVNDQYISLLNLLTGSVHILNYPYEQFVKLNDISSFIVTEIGIEFMSSKVKVVEHKRLTIIIQTSYQCNLKCKYCYQNKYDAGSNGLSDVVVESIICYIKKVLLISDFNELLLSFIGGEPLLHKEKILFIYSQVQMLIPNVYVDINTNGTIFFDDLFKQISNLFLHITLTLKKDHDEKRGGFDEIVSNLKKCRHLNNVHIRYNTDHTNICQFSDFLDWLKLEFPDINYVEAMYTDNYSFNNYKNLLSYETFQKWKSTLSIRNLVERNFFIDHQIPGTLGRCTAYKEFNCKIYSSGKVTLCDEMLEESSRTDIFNIANSPHKLNLIYSEYKMYDPLQSSKCSICPNLLYCGGDLFCHSSMCNYKTSYDPVAFLKEYSLAYLNEYTELFRGMHD